MNDKSKINLSTLKKFYEEGVFANDWQKISECLSPEFKVLEAEGLPYAGEYVGIEEFQNLFHRLVTEYYDNLDIKLHSMAANEDLVFGYLTMTGRARKTGKDISVDVSEISFMKDGLIQCIRPFYWDTKYLAEVLG